MAANGSTKYAMPVPSAKNASASGIHGRTRCRSCSVRPGATNRHTWNRITGIARMTPTTSEILRRIANASPMPV